MALSNSQYNAIMREYERLQAEDRADLERRRQEAYRRAPELRRLEKEPGLLAMERFRRAVGRPAAGGTAAGNSAAGGTGTGKSAAGGNEAGGTADAARKGAADSAAAGTDVTKGFSEELARIEERKQALLKEAGLPPDMLEMRYHCPLCKDTGFTESGKCSCFNARAVRLLYAQSNIDRVLEKENFDVFSLDWYDNERVTSALGVTEREWMKHVLAICREYVEQFPVKHGSILFQGNTGVGKTFLSNCIAKALIERGHSVIYLTAGELFDCMAAVRMEKTEDLSVQELYEWLFRCELLILDDLGTEVGNTFTDSQLFYLVNARLNAKQGTVISTNLSMRMLRDTYTERVTSRISSGYETVMLYGDDIRKQKRMKEYKNGQ